MLRRTPLRRTAMRRKPRKKTPVLDQYRAENPPDELLYYLGVRFTPNGAMSVGIRGIWEPHDEIHHLHCGQRRRPDIRSNLIAVSKEGHSGRHDGIRGEENRYTCLCLMAKWHKSLKMGNTLEFPH